MTTFDVFKEKFNEKFSDVQDFISDFEDDKNSLNAELKVDETEDMRNSYGDRDDRYTKIFYFPEFDIHVEFKGFYQSYHGEEWYKDFREVKPKTKTIEYYE